MEIFGVNYGAKKIQTNYVLLYRPLPDPIRITSRFKREQLFWTNYNYDNKLIQSTHNP